MAYNLNAADYRLPAKYVNKERALPVGSLLFSDGTTQSTASASTTVSGTWTPTFSNQTTVTGTPAATFATYTRVGDVVRGELLITGLSSTAGTGDVGIDITLPVARTAGNFTGTTQAVGTGASIGASTLNADPCRVESNSGAQTLTIEWNEANNGAVSITVQVMFSYRLTN